MHTFGFRPLPVLLLVVGLPLPAIRAEEPRPLEFHLSFDSRVSDQPFTGRVYVMLSKGKINELRSGVSWFKPEPTFARDVTNWKPGETLVIDKDALGYPFRLADLPREKYWIQAVMDFDRGSISFSTAEGNGYSQASEHELDPTASGPIQVRLDQVYKPRPFVESDRVKVVEIESKLLTAFHKRPMTMRAAVVLPKSFATETERKYPVIYEIPGFGGNHRAATNRTGATDVDGVEMLWVVLDPSCRFGHNVFADSDNNGPCGKALVEELIPEIEKRFRALCTPSARFVRGHSSGGWSSLWLQVTYPDFFGGCWSTAPDPVDFRDFQRIDIYKPGANMFIDEQGKERPLARQGEKPVLFYKPFSDMEVVMGHGGQLQSFEAVFGPRGQDGKPARLWDRATGKIDPAVARNWERYDIRLVLERNWATLGPKLRGKLHVYTGELDTYYLDGASKLLKESLRKLDSDAAVELFPGKDHSTVLDKNLRDRINAEIARQFRESQKVDP